MVFVQGTPFSTITIPLGGAQVTSDISIMENISFDMAEKIKLDAGCCWAYLLEEKDDDIIIPGVGGRPPVSVPRSQIAGIIQPRMEEIFRMVKDKLDALALTRPLGGGIVLTGGGAQLMGAAELAFQVFKMPVRIGSPLPVGGLEAEYRSPAYATAVGLVLEGAARETEKDPGPEVKNKEKGQGQSIFGKLWSWLRREFF
jgi:cell division protein FtsA